MQKQHTGIGRRGERGQPRLNKSQTWWGLVLKQHSNPRIQKQSKGKRNISTKRSKSDHWVPASQSINKA
jgi:hypothetical protein